MSYKIKKVNYKLSPNEIKTLLNIKEPVKKIILSKPSKINSKQKIILNKILNKITDYKNKDILKSFNNTDIEIHKLTNKKQNPMAEIYKDEDCCFYEIKKTIIIFLDIDKKLKNNGPEIFYKSEGWLFKNYKVINKFIPKTGDIIIFDSNIYHGQSDIFEDDTVKEKNRYYLEIQLGSERE